MASGHWLGAALGVIGISALPAIWLPAYQMLQMEITPASGRMLVAGLCSMAMSLGFGTVSLSGGYVVTAAGYSWLFLAGASAAALSAALMWSLLRERVFVNRG
jgi:predicted MFS family arabinose efflux permease